MIITRLKDNQLKAIINVIKRLLFTAHLALSAEDIFLENSSIEAAAKAL